VPRINKVKTPRGREKSIIFFCCALTSFRSFKKARSNFVTIITHNWGSLRDCNVGSVH